MPSATTERVSSGRGKGGGVKTLVSVTDLTIFFLPFEDLATGTGAYTIESAIKGEINPLRFLGAVCTRSDAPFPSLSP